MVTKLSCNSAVLLLWVVLLTVYLILHWLQIWQCEEGLGVVELIKSKEVELIEYRKVEKSYYFLIVLILSYRYEERERVRQMWGNVSYWALHNTTLKHYFIVGNDTADYNQSESDVIQVNVAEDYKHLRFKVVNGMREIAARHDFEYILKTDCDVINNIALWEDSIREYNRVSNKAVQYSGALCVWHHLSNSWYSWCSGLGYILHRTAVDYVLNYDILTLPNAEDRAIGEIMYTHGINITEGLVSSTQLRGLNISELNKNYKQHASMHVVGLTKSTKTSEKLAIVEGWRELVQDYDYDQ